MPIISDYKAPEQAKHLDIFKPFHDIATGNSCCCPQFKMNRNTSNTAQHICIHTCPKVSKANIDQEYGDKSVKLKGEFTLYDYLKMECGIKTGVLKDPISKMFYEKMKPHFFPSRV
tara:strand:+ start:4659 stop:5006 length:348 start_codon:yes stop_codon:yes gene_type:complete